MSASNKQRILKVFLISLSRKKYSQGRDRNLLQGTNLEAERISGPSTSRKFMFIIFKSSVKEIL